MTQDQFSAIIQRLDHMEQKNSADHARVEHRLDQIDNTLQKHGRILDGLNGSMLTLTQAGRL